MSTQPAPMFVQPRRPPAQQAQQYTLAAVAGTTAVLQISHEQAIEGFTIDNRSHLAVYYQPGSSAPSRASLNIPFADPFESLTASFHTDYLALRVDVLPDGSVPVARPNETITITLSSLPQGYGRQPVPLDPLPLMSHTGDGASPFTIWTPATGKTVRLYSAILGNFGATAQDVALYEYTPGGVQVSLIVDSLAQIAAAAATNQILFYPNGWKLSVPNNVVKAVGGGALAVGASVFGTEE